MKKIALLLVISVGILVGGAYLIFPKKPKEITITTHNLLDGAKETHAIEAAAGYPPTRSIELVPDNVLNSLMGVLLLIGLVAIFCSLIFPFLFDKWRRKRFPQTRPYRWGYFNGFLMFATPIFALISQGGHPNSDFTKLVFLTTLFFAYPLGLGIILRSPIALGLATLFTLNPIAWIINGIYISKRLAEFDLVRGYFGEIKRAVTPHLPVESQLEVRLIVHDGHLQHPPMTVMEIQSAIQNGRLDINHFYWNEGMQEWHPLSRLYN